MFEPYSREHLRLSYSLFDLIGDLGGVFQLLTDFVGVLFLSIAHHSFILSAMEKLFFVKTADGQIFEEKTYEGRDDIRWTGVMKYLNHSVTCFIPNSENKSTILKEHKAIILTNSLKGKLFWMRCCGSKNRLTKLFDEG